MVALPGAASVPTLTGSVDLYLGDEVLDPQQTIDESPIRHGVFLGLGCPSSQRGPEPRGLVEVRISSGPGAGHVHRLGIGRATLGHGRHCTIRIPELADDPSSPTSRRRSSSTSRPTAASRSLPTTPWSTGRCRCRCGASR